MFRKLALIFSLILTWSVPPDSQAAVLVASFGPAPGIHPCAVSSEDPLQPYLEELQSPGAGAADSPVRAEVEKLVRAYSPRLWWHSRERIRATDPRDFIQNSSLWVFSGDTRRRVADRGQFSLKEVVMQPLQSFLRYEGRRGLAHAEERPPSDPPMLWKLGDGAAARKLCRGPRSTHRVLIEYWYHSPFNEVMALGIGNHQGDWEGVAMLVEIQVDGKTLSHRLAGAFLASHEKGKWLCPQELQWTQPSFTGPGRRIPASSETENHPVVYSALGTHATYSRAGKHPVTVFFSDETNPGFAWDSWKTLRPLVKEPYYGYSGRWGERGLFAFTSGPSAPGPLKAQPRDELPVSRLETCETPHQR